MSASKLKDVCTIGAFKDQTTEAADLELKILKRGEDETLVARCYNHSVALYGYQAFFGGPSNIVPYFPFVCGITCISEIYENSEVMRTPRSNRNVVPPLNLFSKGIKMTTVMKKKDSSLWERYVGKR